MGTECYDRPRPAPYLAFIAVPERFQRAVHRKPVYRFPRESCLHGAIGFRSLS